jgi:hypothetical protein
VTKPVSLDRLRAISRQRSIRRLPAIETDGGRTDEKREVEMATIEWPVPGS